MISFIPIQGIGKINSGDDLASLIASASDKYFPLSETDCFVVASKVIAKAQGRTEKISNSKSKKDVVRANSKRILRERGELIISETHHGFICAQAGIDESNVDESTVVLLPLNLDASAHSLRLAMRNITGVDCPIIISDTFGRPFRLGETNVALGFSGLISFVDLRGKKDFYNKDLSSTTIAIADEIAAGAELVMHKDSGVCAALVRGLPNEYRGNGKGSNLIRTARDDLFR